MTWDRPDTVAPPPMAVASTTTAIGAPAAVDGSYALHLAAGLTRRNRLAAGHTAIFVLGIDPACLLSDGLRSNPTQPIQNAVDARLRHMFRSGDTVIRIAPDEFAVVCTELYNEQEVESVAERILTVVQQPLVDDRIPTPTVHLGVAVTRTAEGDDLLRDAIAAMHRARMRSMTEPMYFTESMRVTLLDHVGRAERLRTALFNDEFRLHYQPIVKTGREEPTAYEALIRWQHPDHGLLGPEHIIPYVGDGSLITEIGRWVIDRACTDASATWSADGPAFHVNIASQQLTAPGFVRDLAVTLDRHGLPPEALCVEITEASLVEAAAAPVVHGLRQLGVSVSIDDFGTGFSSLSYLADLTVDSIKLDRLFVVDLTESQAARAITSAVVDLGHSLGLAVVAEGIETEAQWDHLRDIGCLYGQGFLFARPAPTVAGEAPPLMARARRL